jgi:hypothetical protein
VGDGLSDWYKLNRYKEMEESYREEASSAQPQDISQEESPPDFDAYDSSQKELYMSIINSDIPVLEQLLNVLIIDAQAKIQRRFEICFIGIIMFCLGVWAAYT